MIMLELYQKKHAAAITLSFHNHITSTISQGVYLLRTALIVTLAYAIHTWHLGFHNGFAGPVPKIGAALTMGYCQIAFDFDIIRVEKKYALFLNDWHGKRVGKELD